MDQSIDKVMNVLQNPVVKGSLHLFLFVYAAMIIPALPKDATWIFDNIYFRVAFLFLITWVANKDPALSLSLAITFIAILNFVNNKGLFERFEGPSTAIYPGCMKLTVNDLLESFKNEKEDLLNAMKASRVPENILITDYYAPLIGTYLINRGFVLKSPCNPPGVDQKTGIWSPL